MFRPYPQLTLNGDRPMPFVFGHRSDPVILSSGAVIAGSGSGTGDDTISRPAAAPISAARVVRLTTAGQVVPFNPLDLSLYGEAIGVTVTAAGLAGGLVQVRLAGEIDFAYDAFPAGEALFCGLDGVLTIAPPDGPALLVPVGNSTSTRRMFVDIGDCIELS